MRRLPGAATRFEPMPPMVREDVRERQEAEARVRQEFQTEMGRLEAEARGQFERDLAAELEQARVRHEQAILRAPGGRRDIRALARYSVALGEIETARRTEFERDLAAKKAALIAKQTDVAVRQARRQYFVQYGRHMPARTVQQYREAQAAELRKSAELAAWEAEVVGEFEAEVEAWRRAQPGIWRRELLAWEEAEKKKLEPTLKEEAKVARAAFERQIEAWRAREWKETFKPSIEEFRREWRPRGLAERLLAWEPPPTAKMEIPLATFYGEEETGVQVGFDVGEFLRGTAKGYATAAAAIVAAPETLVYGVAEWTGVKAPRAPPTVTGELIGVGVQAAITGEVKPTPGLERIAEMPYAPTYVVASVLGDIMLGVGISKAVTGTTAVVKKGVTAVGKTRVGEYIGKGVAYYFPVKEPALRVGEKIGRAWAGLKTYVDPYGRVAGFKAAATKKMVKAAETLTEPFQTAYTGIRGFTLRKAVQADVPRGVMKALTVPAEIDEITAALRAEARYGLVTVAPEEVISPKVPAVAWRERYFRGLGMRPITQLQYGAAWGETPREVLEEAFKVPTKIARKKWIVRAVKPKPALLPTEAWARRVVKEFQLRPMMRVRYAVGVEAPLPPEKAVDISRQIGVKKWVTRIQKEALKPPVPPAEAWTRRVVKEFQLKPMARVRYVTEVAEPLPVEKAIRRRVPAEKWIVRRVKVDLAETLDTKELVAKAEKIVSPRAELRKLPKPLSEYIKPLKPTKIEPAKAVDIGKQVLLLKKPEVIVKPKVIEKIVPEIKMAVPKWIVRAQKVKLKPAVAPVKWALRVRQLQEARVMPTVTKLKVKVAPVTLALPRITPEILEKPRERVKFKPAVALKPLVALRQPELAKIAPEMAPKMAPFPAMKVKVTPAQAFEQFQLELPKLTRVKPKKPVLRVMRKKKRKPPDWTKKGLKLLYPIRPEEEVPAFVMGGFPKTKRTASLSDALFGKPKRRRKKQ